MLTFDDGPAPATTARVLDALKRECARASFFLLGRNARAHPQLARRELSEGHTVAHHTFSHPLLNRMPVAAAEAEIDRGFAAVDSALYGRSERMPKTPFFRFPGFASSRPCSTGSNGAQLVVFGADLWASDWDPMTPQQQLRPRAGRLEANRGGIVLFHDTRAQTAAMLPAFLRALKHRGYRVVHVVPASRARAFDAPVCMAPWRRRHRHIKSVPTAAIKGSLNCLPLLFRYTEQAGRLTICARACFRIVAESGLKTGACAAPSPHLFCWRP